MHKILITDDSKSMRKMLAFFLEKNNFNVVEAINGVDALKKLEENPEIVFGIVDVNMPQMDGFTLVKEIRKIDKYKKLPIYFLTTETLVSLKEEGKKTGANGWLCKPVKEKKLIQLVEHVFKKLHID